MSADETPFVLTWTGREADALRAALRLTQDGFAERLGVSTRSVCRWRAEPEKTLSNTVQQMLDVLFEQLEGDLRVMRRFVAALRGSAADPRARREMAPPVVMAAEMTLMQARIDELQAQLAEMEAQR